MLVNTLKLHFIDIHYHASPDLYTRRYNALQAAKQYKNHHGAVVLKSHLGSTTLQAGLLQQEGLPVFGSLVLNKIAGGLDYRCIAKALSEYNPSIPSKMIVHFPTITGRQHHSRLKRTLARPELVNITMQSETLFDDSHQLKPAVIEILKFSKDHPIILSTGHANKDETYALIEACDKYSVSSLLLNQPANPLTGLSFEELDKMKDLPFLWIEQTALTYLLNYQTKKDFKNVLSKAQRVIYSSDLGQHSQMDITHWLARSDTWFDEFKLSYQRRNEICLENPASLLGI